MKESTRRYIEIFNIRDDVEKEWKGSKDKLVKFATMALPPDLHKEAEDLVEKIIARFNVNQYLNEAAKILEKHYSDDEMDTLVNLYETHPVLMKSNKLTLTIAKESIELSERMLTEATMKELLVLEAEDAFLLGKETFDA